MYIVHVNIIHSGFWSGLKFTSGPLPRQLLVGAPLTKKNRGEN